MEVKSKTGMSVKTARVSLLRTSAATSKNKPIKWTLKRKKRFKGNMWLYRG